MGFAVHRMAWRSAAWLILVGLAAAAAHGAVLKHKETDEVIRGTLTAGRINDRAIFSVEGGGNRFIRLEDWTVVEPDDGTVTESAGGASGDGSKATRVYIIPITGPIMSSSLVSGFEKAVADAKKRRTDVLVLRLDTPGGRVDLAQHIIRLVASADWARCVAWVEGTEAQGAISAGAYISLAAAEIYMAPGTTLGGAVPYTRQSGSAEVDEKMQSIFRARFRALAQQRGHSALLADAMVDSSVEVVQVFVDGRQRFVPPEEATQLQRYHAGTHRFRRGRTIVKEGKVLTLTADEAAAYGVAKGIASTPKELMSAMGIEAYTITEATWLPDFARKDAEQNKKQFETYRQMFVANILMAVQMDPHVLQHPVKDELGTFVDGGRRWRAHSERCLVHLRKCAQALKGFEKMSAADRADYRLPDSLLTAWKTHVQTMYARVSQQRNTTRLP